MVKVTVLTLSASPRRLLYPWPDSTIPLLLRAHLVELRVRGGIERGCEIQLRMLLLEPEGAQGTMGTQGGMENRKRGW